MSPADPSLRFLHGLQGSGIKAGLGNIRVLLLYLGRPERSFPSIHVAGTNGKGSTSAMIAAALTAAGFRTGLYTSPHLIDFTERIRIDGKKIPLRRVSAYTRRLRRTIRAAKATFFEATTAIAFQYFADEGVDVAVIETGLGGRWDSTNVVTPLVSVITSIGMEHREYLGNTLRKIAFEKAGIIKRGVPCVVGNIPVPAMDVIKNRAARLNSRVI
ncbi:MAG TPA: Mur ligase family protein, partial [Bacteroidota bacterium]|nr:Mur ligase family protein [Bacteroidota bacterium]